MSVARGAMIVFEGCDRVGKSTQCRKLVEALHAAGKKCKLLHFPDRATNIGKQIDDYLQNKMELPDRSVHLLFAANRWELEAEMMNTLTKGTSLIIDRYAYSGVAYTAAKQVASLTWCKSPDIGLPCPDRVFYLMLPAASAEQRAVYGDERYEKVSFQKQVENQYEKLKRKEWLTIDASRDIQVIHAEVLEDTLATIRNCATKPIIKLWTDSPC